MTHWVEAEQEAAAANAARLVFIRTASLYPSIDENILDGLERYLTKRVPTGGFLRAVLENNLKEAFQRADEYNAATLRDIVSLCYQGLPSECWGSPERVADWLAGGQ